MKNSRHPFTRAGVLTLAAMALVSCGESTAPLNVSSPQLQSMGESVASQIEGGVRQLTAQGVMNTSGGAPSFARFAGTSATMSRGLAFSRSTSGSAAAQCGVASQSPPTDTDGDLVPDNFSVTFALPACHFDNQGSTVDMTGVLRISDPQPGTAGMALNFSLDNLRLQFSGPDGSGTVLADGSASVSAAASGLSQTLHWNESATMTGAPSVGATIDWAASFAAVQGQSIVVGQAIPDGAYLINGSVNYHEGNRAATFSITTVTPLQYSKSCAAGVDQGTALSPFSAGKVRVAVTSQQGSAYAEVTYASCGMATVVVVAG